MERYFPYEPSNPKPVLGEEHQIVHGKILLRHVPAEGSLTIDGFIETDSPAELAVNEFFCAYSAETLYREANRIVYFNPELHGQTVTCNYGAVGTPLTADDANEIKEHLDGSTQQMDELISRQNNLVNRFVDLQEEVREAIDGIEPDACLAEKINCLSLALGSLSSDVGNLQSLIDAEQLARERADDDLQRQIDSLSVASQSLAATDNFLQRQIDSLSVASQSLAATDNFLQTQIDSLSVASQSLAATDNFLQAQIDSLSVASQSLAATDANLQTQIDGLGNALSAFGFSVAQQFDFLYNLIEQGGASADVSALEAAIDSLQTQIDLETQSRISADDSHDEQIAGVKFSIASLSDSVADQFTAVRSDIANRMFFAGASSSFPPAPVTGEFAFVDRSPYVFDGLQWRKLSTDVITPAGYSFIDIIYANKPHQNYSSVGKADFLTYVFGEETPQAYSTGGAISKAAFINHVF